MKYIDLHCDTAFRMLYEGEKLKSNNLSIDIEKMKMGETLAQVFAFFIELDKNMDPYLEFEKMYLNFISEIEANKETIEIVRNIKELETVEAAGKLASFLSIEEGEVLKGDIKKLRSVYEKGIRLITLTWNFENSLGYPNCISKFRNTGLKDKGLEMVYEMEKMGMLPDASHLSDGGFYDLINHCKKPFIVTHSNSRTITNHSRNLTDEMIKDLANKGGVMGLNFCSAFLRDNVTSIDIIPTIEDMMRHIKHIRNIGGVDVIALGSDFDGIENKVEINDASEMNKLRLALEADGFSINEIEKIFYKNTLRLFKDTLK